MSDYYILSFNRYITDVDSSGNIVPGQQKLIGAGYITAATLKVLNKLFENQVTANKAEVGGSVILADIRISKP